MTHKIEDGVTDYGTNAPRKIARTFGKCCLCPPWREPRELVNGLCIDHRIWDTPQHINAAGQGEKPQKARE